MKGSEDRGRALTPTDPMAGLPPAANRRPPVPGRLMQSPSPQSKNAAIIYGAGGAILYCLAFYNLASAEWFNGLMLMLPATCLAYLAYRYLIQEQ